jgi:hypothetical protein
MTIKPNKRIKGNPLRPEEMDLAKRQGISRFDSQDYIKKFGSWNNFLKTIGEISNDTSTRKWRQANK